MIAPSGVDMLSWTSDDPRQSQLFSKYGVAYRFHTDDSRGVRSTTLYRAGTRANKEERAARLEWAANGGLGRAIIGKTTLAMADLVKADPRDPSFRSFTGPDGQQYLWRPSPTNPAEVVLQDPNGNVIAMVRRIRPTRFPLGDVYAELHFMQSNTGVMPTLLADTVCVTAMLYRFCIAYGIY